MSAQGSRSDRQRMTPGAADGSVAIQPWARPFVAVLVTGFVICGLFGIEAWPFSGFRLFSAPRPPTWSSFHGEVLGPDGEIARLRVASLPTAYRGFGLVAARLPSQPGPERLALCRVYAHAAEAAGTPIDELRIYREDHVVLPRKRGLPITPVVRTFIASCAPGHVP